METFSDIELCAPLPSIFGENGCLHVTDGDSVWTVIITREAMRATASPPEASLKRLVRHADIYRQMAYAAIYRHEDDNGKIWIFEKDVLERRAIEPHHTTSPIRARS